MSEIVNHLISSAEFRESPNCSERPSSADVTLLVIHNISLPPGHFGGVYISDFFQNKLDVSVDQYFEEIKNLKVSSHLLIDRLAKSYSLSLLIKVHGMQEFLFLKDKKTVMIFL